jgi:hypothetical protein
MASLRNGNGNGKKSNIHTDDLDWGEAFQVFNVATTAWGLADLKSGYDVLLRRREIPAFSLVGHMGEDSIQ